MDDTMHYMANKLNNHYESTTKLINNSEPIKTKPLSSSKPLPDVISNIRSSFAKPGCYPAFKIRAGGFEYTNNGDTARCKDCNLEISNWRLDMDPFTEHATRRPDCSFVHSKQSSKSVTSSPCSISISTPIKTPASLPPSTSSTSIVRSKSISNEQENPSKRQKIDTTEQSTGLTTLVEVETTQQIRRRTFSHWPHRTTPSQAQMIEAGFFNCNVGDRVICIYCNLICQQWTPHTDDPCEVHKTLSPNCIYVKAKLLRRESNAILIVNEAGVGAVSANRSSGSNNLEPIRYNEIVHTAAVHPLYAELPKRSASFANWPNENLPPVDDLVRAGFFFTGSKNIVTCFYCNGSLQNWGANDNPMIEHARWFPQCAYAKQLCGDDLYRKIQESKRAHQERVRASEGRDRNGPSGSTSGNNNTNANSRQLVIADESTLSRLVAARLDLPISQNLLNKNFKLSIIKRCWEDQLRLKRDDFVSDTDLYMACLILQKQIEHIDGKKENIVIPSVRMKKIREETASAEALAREQTSMRPPASNITQTMSNTPDNMDVEMTTTSQTSTNESTSSTESIPQTATTKNQDEPKIMKLTASNTNEQKQTNDASPVNPCVLCLTEEKRLACIPCGHLATCVPCGHSLRSCPMCRREIEAFVRVYI